MKKIVDDGSSTQREQKIESQDDMMTEVAASDSQAIVNESLKTKLSLEGQDMKDRLGSKGQDSAGDQIEEDIFQGRDEQLFADCKKNEEESGEENWQKGSMDITMSQLTPEKNSNKIGSEADDKE